MVQTEKQHSGGFRYAEAWVGTKERRKGIEYKVICCGSAQQRYRNPMLTLARRRQMMICRFIEKILKKLYCCIQLLEKFPEFVKDV